ncbi:MAG: cysteine hydrolase, partial [Chloroflexota bacterium]|nr:cysteine hydrolase [Chloroflexota bacterium]
MLSARAEPYDFEFDPATTALVMIDFQRDFVYPGGFGESLGNDTSPLLEALGPAQKVLEACRAAGMFVIHTREGHRADLSDLPKAKYERGNPTIHIGDEGPMGRLLVRGSHGHDIVEELYPIDGEPIVDKPGKGAFYATDLDAILKLKGI